MDMLPGVTLTGKVSMISSIGSTVNGLVKYRVTVALDPTPQPVRFGATANVTLHTGQPHSILAVPPAAIQSDSAGEYILLVNSDGTSERVAVTSAGASGGLMTFTTTSTGLKPGSSQVLLGTGAANTNGG
jgi:multidrug efflux pump subunit AcrA (membrane-fusion protein)